jgi:hypothetical protein
MSILVGLGFIAYSRYRSQVFAELDKNELKEESNDGPEIIWSEKIYQLDPIINIDKPEVGLLSDSSDVERLKIELEKERVMRQETETHLRITRKALSTMNREEPRPALDQNPKSSISSESNHLDLELNVANLKRELVKAKHEIRMHVAARAKALSTANKSVAFARQSIELRARLETELETAHAALAIRQTTISSLISRLERERRLTDDELATLAKHVAVTDPKLKPDFSQQRVVGLEKQ